MWAKELFEALVDDDRKKAEAIIKKYECVNDYLFSVTFDASSSSQNSIYNSQMNFEKSSTCLHIAVSNDSIKCCKMLIRLGADLALRDGLHRLPSELSQSKKITKLLEKYTTVKKSNKTTKNSVNKTPTINNKKLIDLDCKIDEIRAMSHVDSMELRRELDGLSQLIKAQEGRLLRQLQRKSQFIYASLDEKFSERTEAITPEEFKELKEELKYSNEQVQRTTRKLEKMTKKIQRVEEEKTKLEDRLYTIEGMLEDLEESLLESNGSLKNPKVIERIVHENKEQIRALQNKRKFCIIM